MLYRKNTAGSFFLTKWVLLAAERLRLLFKKKEATPCPCPWSRCPGLCLGPGPSPPPPVVGPGRTGGNSHLLLAWPCSWLIINRGLAELRWPDLGLSWPCSRALAAGVAARSPECHSQVFPLCFGYFRSCLLQAAEQRALCYSVHLAVSIIMLAPCVA